MKNSRTSASRRIALAAVAMAFALIAAACGGSEPNSKTPADTLDYHDDPDLYDDTDNDDDTADHHDDDTNNDDDDTADHHDDDTDNDDDTADHHDGDTDNDDDTADHHETGGAEDTGSGGDHHGSAGAPTRYDADVADAAQTVTVEVVGDDPVGGHQRVQVDLGSVVAVMVTSDTGEEVHVHGYDILRAVSDGHPAHFAFTAEIPGVFEVEFEGSGRLLLQLEIS